MTSNEFNPDSLYALIIGINEYLDEYPSLRGAKPDAIKFNLFLSEKLAVPECHRSIMLNSTRDEIIFAFTQLKEGRLRINEHESIEIPKGSAFVLYYAGHGGRTAIPKEWTDYRTADGQVEQLVPSDIGQCRGSDSIQGIPDRTVAAVLKGLMERIGDNVVSVIPAFQLRKNK